MNKKVRNLCNDIEDLKKTLEFKEKQLAGIQKYCIHVWPTEWQERTEEDFYRMSAIDPALRRSEPDIIVVRFQACKLCGKERTRKKTVRY